MQKNLSKLLLEINQEIIARIDKLTISKSEFCKLAGIHRYTLRKMHNPRIKTLQKIEETLQKLGV